MSELSELYQQVILDHNKKPRNFRKLETANHSAEGFNPLCGDQLTVYLSLEDDEVKEITFEGSGCAISNAWLLANLMKKLPTAWAILKYFPAYANFQFELSVRHCPGIRCMQR